MDKIEAIDNLKFILWLFLLMGFLAIFSGLYYYGKSNNLQESIESIFNIVFGLTILYLSHKIQSSIKILK